jgi:hypothetical protein
MRKFGASKPSTAGWVRSCNFHFFSVPVPEFHFWSWKVEILRSFYLGGSLVKGPLAEGGQPDPQDANSGGGLPVTWPLCRRDARDSESDGLWPVLATPGVYKCDHGQIEVKIASKCFLRKEVGPNVGRQSQSQSMWDDSQSGCSASPW